MCWQQCQFLLGWRPGASGRPECSYSDLVCDCIVSPWVFSGISGAGSSAFRKKQVQESTKCEQLLTLWLYLYTEADESKRPTCLTHGTSELFRHGLHSHKVSVTFEKHSFLTDLEFGWSICCRRLEVSQMQVCFSCLSLFWDVGHLSMCLFHGDGRGTAWAKRAYGTIPLED
jgi:hypothetical protein